jgi:Fe-Mn family superoxide dismutase
MINDKTRNSSVGAQHLLPPLPYAENALDPVISARTIGIHYGKHHKTYVDNLNKLITDTELTGLTLQEIMSKTAGQVDKAGIFNNAAQVWNHTFYWNSLSQKGGGEPPVVLKQKIENSFGDLDSCKKELATAAMTQFGSGWAWLVMNGDKLEVTKTANAGSPLSNGVKPILVIDVWEHAYYLDYQNRRVDYVNAVIEKLINWGFAESNLG